MFSDLVNILDTLLTRGVNWLRKLLSIMRCEVKIAYITHCEVNYLVNLSVFLVVRLDIYKWDTKNDTKNHKSRVKYLRRTDGRRTDTIFLRPYIS